MHRPTIKILTTALVLIHFAGNAWHGDAHATLNISLPEWKAAYVTAVIVIAPLFGMVLMWTRFETVGSGIVGLSMVGSVLFSVYHHYVLISIDNVDHLPAGTAEAHAHFSNSAELIALSALAAALAGFYSVGGLINRRTPGLAQADTEAPRRDGRVSRSQEASS